MIADALELLLAGQAGLESHGTAATAEEGLERCRTSCPDVVLMDVDLPGMDGLSATRALLQLCPDTKVVVVTALRRPELLAEAIEAGACGFVPKSHAAEELIDVVRRAAEGDMVLPAGDPGPLLHDLMRARSLRTEADRVLGSLTGRELEILEGLAAGSTARELSASLFISPHTVESHISSILAKLQARSRLDAVLRALRLGIVELSGDDNSDRSD